MDEKREAARAAVADAVAAWEKAPGHMRMMAGAYVGPLLAALVAVIDAIPEGGK